jgi:WD40 repeat protein
MRLPVVALIGLMLLAPDAPRAPVVQPARWDDGPDPIEQSATDAHGDSLPPGALARIGTVRFRAPDLLESVSLSADGSRFVGLCETANEVQVWNLAPGFREKAIEVPKYLVPVQRERNDFDSEFPRDSGIRHEQLVGLTVTPDGNRARAVTRRGALVECDLATGLWSAPLARAVGPIADGNRSSAMVFATASQDASLFAFLPKVKPYAIEILSPARPNPLLTLRDAGFGAEGNAPAFSPDNRFVAIPLEGGTVKVWRLADGKEVAVLRGPSDTRAMLPVWSPDGARLACSFNPYEKRSLFHDGTFVVWDVPTFAERCRGAHRYGYAKAFSPDGTKLLVELRRHTAEYHHYDTTTGAHLRGTATAAEPYAWLAYSAAARRFANIGSRDCAIRVWDADTLEEVRRFDAPRGAVRALAFAPNGRTLLVASSESSAVGVWDARTGARRARLEVPDVWGHDFAVAFLPGGERALAAPWIHGSGPRDVRPVTGLDLARGTTVPLNFGHLGGARQLVPSRGGDCFATLDGTGTVRVLDTATGALLRAGKCDPAGRIARAEREEVLCVHTVRVDRTGVRFEVFDALGERALTSWPAHEGRLCAVSGNGRVAVGTERAGGREWFVPRWTFTGARLSDIPATYNWHTVALSHDGTRLAFSAPDPKRLRAELVELFDTETGAHVATFTGHGAEVTALAFSPCGTKLASGSFDSTVLVWAVPPAR